MAVFKMPMLAKDYDPAKLVFPVWASPKIDAYRCVGFEGAAMTRTGKKFRNEFLQKFFGENDLDGLDGELCVGEFNSPEVFNASSGLVKTTGEPDFTWYVFDDFTNPEHDYETRLLRVASRVKSIGSVRVVMLRQTLIQNMEELDAFEAEQIALGFEGVMLRRAKTPYKHGRSTVNEGYLLKVKRFSHEEGEIVGFQELMHNGNESYINEVGMSKRSDCKNGLYPSGMIGAYIVKNDKYAKTFNVSCGSMNHQEKKLRLIMASGDMGRAIRYKFLEHGTKDVPRHGIFAGFRDDSDILPTESD